MGRIAIDVVLLLSEDMADEVIAANRVLVERFGSEIVLNKTDCLPHVSLAMGGINEGGIEAIGEVLERLAREQDPGELRVLGVAASENAVGQKVSCFELEPGEKLQRLHETVMAEMGRYMNPEVSEEMLADKQVSESTLQWIRDYKTMSSFGNFRPHITIGYGQMEEQVEAKTFRAPKLALCRLGNHCTCRKVLISVEFE